MVQSTRQPRSLWWRTIPVLRARIGLYYIVFGLLVMIGGWVFHSDVVRGIGDRADVITIVGLLRDHRWLPLVLGLVPIICGVALVRTGSWRWFWHLLAVVWGMAIVGVVLAYFTVRLAELYSTT